MAFVTLDDFIADTTTNLDQTKPAVAALSDGRFVVTWASLDNGTDTDIRARIFNSDGTPATVNGSTTDFLVSTTNANAQNTPTVTALANGQFFITWSSSNGSDFDIRGALFNADGTRAVANGSTNDFLINTTTQYDQTTPVVTTLASGEFVVAWDSVDVPFNGTVDDQHEIHGRVFAANGTPVSVNGSINDFVMNTPGSASSWSLYPPTQVYPSVAALADGGFFATWQAYAAYHPFASYIRGEIFNADGSARTVNGSTNDFEVSSYPASGPEPTRFYDHPASATLTNGQVVIAWLDEGASQVHARLFNADGTPVSVDGSTLAFDVGFFSSNGGNVFNPNASLSITGLQDGGFFVTWDSYNGSDYDIYGRLYLADGTAPDSALLVGHTTTGDQTAPQVTELADGDLAVAFQSSDGGDGSGTDVHVALLDPFGTTLIGDNGDNTLVGGPGDQVLEGLGGNDTLDGGPGADYLSGGDGNDLIYFDNQDTVDGGNGLDFASAYNSPGGISIDTAAAHVEGVYGSAFADTIDAHNNGVGGSFYGNDGNDTITGTPYADYIDGGAGADVLNGGAGNDTIAFDNQDTIDGGPGSDFATAFFSPAGITINTGATSIEGVYGSAFDDIIDASTQPTGGSFYGYDGHDTITGSAFSDYISGGRGADVLNGGAGDDTIEFDSQDTINGGPGADFATAYSSQAAITINTGATSIEGVYGSPFNDVIDASTQSTGGAFYGNDGDDVITGSPFADTISGGNGANTLNGGAGNDTIDFTASDTINGGPGFDFATAFSSPSSVIINTAATSVEGVYGSAFNDVIDASTQSTGGSFYGSDGNDVLYSSAGSDFFDGGNGFDYMVYNAPSSAYTWTATPTGWSVTENATGVTDNLVNVEVLRFSNGQAVL
jgi:Ca2+-binding RTX toxin-like protein